MGEALREPSLVCRSHWSLSACQSQLGLFSVAALGLPRVLQLGRALALWVVALQALVLTRSGMAFAKLPVWSPPQLVTALSTSGRRQASPEHSLRVLRWVPGRISLAKRKSIEKMRGADVAFPPVFQFRWATPTASGDM